MAKKAAADKLETGETFSSNQQAYIAELEDEVRKLKHRVVKRGKVAVDEKKLKELFGILWAQKIHKLDRKYAANCYAKLFEIPKENSGQALMKWLFQKTEETEPV